ncbi:MAG: hypothetical protein ACLQDQ_19925 [Myxococcaceae bacterium]
MKLLPGLVLAVALGGPPRAQAADETPANMEKYYRVLLRRPANAPPLDEAALEALQKRHLGHLQAMYETGKLVLAGPFDEQTDETHVPVPGGDAGRGPAARRGRPGGEGRTAGGGGAGLVGTERRGQL